MIYEEMWTLWTQSGGISSLKLLFSLQNSEWENIRKFLKLFQRCNLFTSLNRKPETTFREFDSFLNRQKGNIIQKCTVVRYGFKELYVSKEVK